MNNLEVMTMEYMPKKSGKESKPEHVPPEKRVEMVKNLFENGATVPFFSIGTKTLKFVQETGAKPTWVVLSQTESGKPQLVVLGGDEKCKRTYESLDIENVTKILLRTTMSVYYI